MMAVSSALSQLWGEGIQIQWRSTTPYEIDPWAIRISQVLTKSVNSDPAFVIHPHVPVDQFPTLVQSIPLEHHSHIMVSVFEMVPPAMDTWQEQISMHMGNRSSVTTGPDMAARDRDFYTIPACRLPPDVTPHIYRLPLVFPDGSTWPAVAGSGCQPPTLRAIYPELIRREHQGHTKSNSDFQTLQKFKIRQPDGRIRYAGPAHLAHLLGFCRASILDLTHGFPCESPEHCAYSVLCDTCAQVCTALGRAWNLPVASKVIYQAIRTAILEANTRAPLVHSAQISLFTSGSPCTKISRGALMDRQQLTDFKLGPHAFPSNTMWQWHAGLVTHSRRAFAAKGKRTFFLAHNKHECSEDCELADTISIVRKFSR